MWIIMMGAWIIMMGAVKKDVLLIFNVIKIAQCTL